MVVYARTTVDSISGKLKLVESQTQKVILSLNDVR